MSITRAPFWTDQYYRVVQHYFWSPQRIGRVSDRSKKAHPWAFWKAKLESQETPLNHIMDVFFHISPPELLDQIASSLVGRNCSGVQLVHADGDTLDSNVVQPDVILLGEKDLVFLELKVDSRSSVDQFTKYAVAAYCICLEASSVENVDLVLVTRDPSSSAPWKYLKTRGVDSLDQVRIEATNALQGDPMIWREKGVQKYLKANPESRDRVCRYVQTMGAHLGDYRQINEVLSAYAAEEKTLERLIQGVLAEFKKRDLV